ncbi:hypothetical protein M8J76_010760 [Diaphorina citri]|nr:hypothetical protein M8J76_010760 [Diaphorina citri]
MIHEIYIIFIYSGVVSYTTGAIQGPTVLSFSNISSPTCGPASEDGPYVSVASRAVTDSASVIVDFPNVFGRTRVPDTKLYAAPMYFALCRI